MRSTMMIRSILMLYVLSAIPVIVQCEQIICPSRPSKYTCNYTCQVEESKLFCDNDLPDYWHIPNGTVDIYITNFQRDRLNERNHIFNHTRWQDVRKLTIKCPPILSGYLDLNDYDFSSLPLLESLSIHAPELREIKYKAFVGMVKLSYLDLSECRNLKIIDTLTNALSNTNIRFKLTNLILNEIGNYKPKPINIDIKFQNMLVARSVVNLSLQRTNLFFHIPCNANISALPLEYLDISDSTLFYQSKVKQPCGVHEAEYSIRNVLNYFKNIKEFNISSSFKAGRFKNKNSEFIVYNSPRFQLPSIHSLDVSNTLKINPAFFKHFDISLWNIKNLYLNSNFLTTVNCTSKWPPNLSRLELSSNGMTFLAPMTLRGLPFLQFLTLDNNLLYRMVGHADFSDIFVPLLNLESIDLRNNSFYHLPYDIFKGNPKLKSINLKDNKLSTLTFNINHLIQLEMFDLQNNMIVNLDNSAFQNFLFIYDQRKFTFRLHGNRFECVCENVNFVQWITSNLQNNNTSVYTCALYGETVSLDKKSVDTTLYLCHRTSIIRRITIPSGIVIVIACIATITICRIRQRQKHNTIMEHFFQKLLYGKLAEKYLVFLSFSNNDCDFIAKYVQPQLKENLSNTYDIPEKLIVIGDGIFRLGISIFNEIIRCVKSSCVVVFVVSQSFCDSQWCRMEFKEAVEQEKPIILLFKEDVNMTDMSDELRTVFDRNTRSKFVQNGDIFEPVGGWRNCCESIVKLSVDEYILKERVSKRKRKLKGQEYDEVELRRL